MGPTRKRKRKRNDSHDPDEHSIDGDPITYDDMAFCFFKDFEEELLSSEETKRIQTIYKVQQGVQDILEIGKKNVR